jgi:hypothetical protein
MNKISLNLGEYFGDLSPCKVRKSIPNQSDMILTS